MFPVSLPLFFLFFRPCLIHARLPDRVRAFVYEVYGHTFLHSWSGPRTLVVGLLHGATFLSNYPLVLFVSFIGPSWKGHLVVGKDTYQSPITIIIASECEFPLLIKQVGVRWSCPRMLWFLAFLSFEVVSTGMFMIIHSASLLILPASYFIWYFIITYSYFPSSVPNTSRPVQPASLCRLRNPRQTKDSP